jgi:hypothetical protein
MFKFIRAAGGDDPKNRHSCRHLGRRRMAIREVDERIRFLRHWPRHDGRVELRAARARSTTSGTYAFVGIGAVNGGIAFHHRDLRAPPPDVPDFT